MPVVVGVPIALHIQLNKRQSVACQAIARDEIIHLLSVTWFALISGRAKFGARAFLRIGFRRLASSQFEEHASFFSLAEREKAINENGVDAERIGQRDHLREQQRRIGMLGKPIKKTIEDAGVILHLVQSREFRRR